MDISIKDFTDPLLYQFAVPLTRIITPNERVRIRGTLVFRRAFFRALKARAQCGNARSRAVCASLAHFCGIGSARGASRGFLEAPEPAKCVENDLTAIPFVPLPTYQRCLIARGPT